MKSHTTERMEEETQMSLAAAIALSLVMVVGTMALAAIIAVIATL